MKKRTKWQEEIMKHGELYRVGGSVRDRLMGIAHAQEDEDYLVRGLTPKRLEEVLSPHGRIQLVGKSFGVYKFKPAGEVFEHDIAFPRREVSTGPGHRDFQVAPDRDLPVEADLGRRDFTINAIAENVRDGRFLDPFGGRKDIEARTLRMIFPKAFDEDPLRILRGVRFAARFSLEIEAKTAAAMKRAASLLDTLSAERIQDEFDKLFSQCDEPSRGFEWMQRLGALAVVFPELDRSFGVEQNEYHPDDVFWHSVKTCDRAPKGNLLLRWAALLHDLGKVDKRQVVTEGDGAPRVVFYGHEEVSTKIAEDVLKRLRYGNDFVRRCSHLVRHHMFYYQPEWNRSTVRRFIRRVGEENIEDLFALRAADLRSRDLTAELARVDELRERVRSEIEAAHALKIEDLAIDGEDVMTVVGIEAGKRVGDILQEVFERVLETPSLNDRAKLLEILKREYR